MNTNEADKNKGIYQKFRVERTDGSSALGGKHEKCNYFVLDLDHDPHAAAALRTYAHHCVKDYPVLAHELVDLAWKLDSLRSPALVYPVDDARCDGCAGVRAPCADAEVVPTGLRPITPDDVVKEADVNYDLGRKHGHEEKADLLDWAETLLCNAAPMAHCTQVDWDDTVRRWRDEKHGACKSNTGA